MVIAPDIKLNQERDLPAFQILESGFSATKQFRKYKNTVVAGDVNRGP